METEDRLSVQEVVNLCNTINDDNIEINLDPIERPKNVEFVANYGLTSDDLKDIVHGISVNDYVKGPVLDNNPIYKRPVWIFIEYVNNIRVEVYLKIKITNHKKKVYVLSIHEEGIYDE